MNESDRILIRKLAKELEVQGLHFEGVFGSRANGTSQDSSDYDLLYSEPIEFRKKFLGWDRIHAIEGIRNLLEDQFQIHLDLVSIDALGELGKKYILKGRLVNV